MPISINRLRRLEKLFVAVEIYRNGKWTNEFPSAVRIAKGSKREIPVSFAGNEDVD